MKKIIIPIFFTVMVFVSCMKTIDVYTITATSNDITMGVVKGGGVYMNGSTAELIAKPNSGFKFYRWKDEYGYSNTENPRHIIVEKDASYKAIFSNALVRIKNDSLTSDYEYFETYIDSSQKRMVFVAAPTTTLFPKIKLQYDWDGEITTGLFFGYSETDIGASDNPCLWYFYNPDSDIYGNGWGKNIALTISKIDLDALLVSFVADVKVIQDYYDSNTTSFQLTITATDIPLILR